MARGTVVCTQQTHVLRLIGQEDDLECIIRDTALRIMQIPLCEIAAATRTRETSKGEGEEASAQAAIIAFNDPSYDHALQALECMQSGCKASSANV